MVQEDVALLVGMGPKAAKGNKFTRSTRHWVAVIIDILLAAFPLIWGVVGFFVDIDSVATYLFYCFFIAANYYNTKNFAGRFLARLRWHTYVVDGKTYYYFESMKKEDQTPLDNTVFWICLWFNPGYYLILTLADIITLKATELPIMLIGFLAGGSNLWAYIKCSQDASKKMKQMATSIGKSVASQALSAL